MNDTDQICKHVKIIPLEVITRNIVAGSMAKRYGFEEGMKRCAEASTIFDDWVRQSEEDYKAMLIYLSNNHFSKIGELTEKNSREQFH